MKYRVYIGIVPVFRSNKNR